MELMRLQKFLSSAGVCSRRKGEEYIEKGFVKVNGKTVNTPGTKVDPSKDKVEVKGKKVSIKSKNIYIALNKPVNYETTCKKSRGKIVLDIVKIPERVYPVGRLDKDSEGLILLTNDGRVHHRLSHPSYEHEKEYEVTAKNRITDTDLKKMADGLQLKEFKTMPCKIRRLTPDSFNIVLKEGKNRQIRKMVEHTGNEVARLKRRRITNIKLGQLKTGKWRYLSENEIKGLMKIIFKKTGEKNSS